MNEQHQRLLDELKKPFHPSVITWKPGATTKAGDKCLAMAYADLRAYQNRLDEVCGMDWSVTFTPWGDRVICHLTILGVTRSSTGEPDAQSERSEIAGTATEAQAFKRAAAMFGLGRYLYGLPAIWVEYDKERRQIADVGKAKLEKAISSHYQRETGNAGQRPQAAHRPAPASPVAEQAQATAQGLRELKEKRQQPPALPETLDELPELDPDGGAPAEPNPFHSAPASNGAPAKGLPITDHQRKLLHVLGTAMYNGGWEQKRHELVKAITKGRSESSNDLTGKEAGKIIAGIEVKLRERYGELVDEFTGDPNVIVEVDELTGFDLVNAVKALQSLTYSHG